MYYYDLSAVCYFHPSLIFTTKARAHPSGTPYRGLYYKPITIINDDSSVINQLETSLTDDARVIIYNRLMFIVQAIELHSEDRLNGRGSAVNRLLDGGRTYLG